MVADGSDRKAVLARSRGLRPASARSLLLTVLGEYVLPTGRPVWTSTLLAAFGELGVAGQAARQAINRAATAGWLTSERDGRRAAWSLSPAGHRLLSDGAERIYSFQAVAADWDGQWLVLLVSVPETRRELRGRLRTQLSWAGFGSPAPGVWVSPDVTRKVEARQILRELSLDVSVMSFSGTFGGIGVEETIVRQAWDLPAIAAAYDAFIERFSDDVLPESSVLAAHTLLVHEWRRFPFRDPGLPARLLPDGWSGTRAAALFRDRHDSWRAAAARRWGDLASS